MSTGKKAQVTDGTSAREIEGVIKSAKRVLELFEYFAECRRPLSVTDLVRGLNYPQSSASALLKSLTRLGYLDYDRQKRLYVPTLRVALFGGWVQDQLFSQTSLSHLIDELHAASGGEAVILGMQNDIYVQYIHLVQAPQQQVPSWYIKPGSLRPLCRSAAGRILLSRKTDVEVQQLLWRINAEEEPHLRMQVSDLLKELDRIRQDGYAYTEGTVNPGVGVLAVEMPTPPSQPPMALGIGGRIDTLRMDRERYLALLNEALQPYRARTPSGRP
ncbi:IclR family transcriptional regulator [Acidovorax cavernicola]|uniref:IclR family transcriptional regulator n=1 Tax=Acidovorax cavernicola TaxID=1675792 RepID=A0A9X8D7A1_9BURK|nr:helix-turn-helix domain-containing protein [Acidovorax cavernicola]RIX83217.1 IclR family transcriptional regulator [Acidovorax cavernicola]